jgi:glycosyltransferase involved in cell wall biosynthesis
MKNVAIIIASLAGGGAERVMLTLAQTLIEKGNSVTFFCLKPRVVHMVPLKINVVFPFKDRESSLRGWFNGKKLAAILKESLRQVEAQTCAFDMVLVNLHESYRLADLCAFKNTYFVIHNSFSKELQREKRMGPSKYFYMRNIVKRMSGKHLIAVSKGVAKELKTAAWYKPASVTTIYNPFDVQEIKALANQTLEQAPTDKYIVHVGRAAKAKRHDVLFAALKLLDPKLKLVCLSGSTKKLRKLSVKMGIKDRVILPGFTTNPYPWIKNAEVLALSSDFEGLPTVLIEAIVCGTKVVSTDCPHGPSEILLGMLSEFLVPPQNPPKLASAIEAALKADLDLSNAEILSKIDAEDVAKAYLSLC